MATQLRDYRIRPGALDEFVQAFRTHLWPIRERLGFTLVGAWTIPEENRFVWIVSHPGDWEAYEEADRAYHASPARTALDPNPGRLIEEQRIARLTPI
ncbi:MAG TPA: NIPSNAP family protein [candidate division Zixibacteria bacterium]|nr:NIPSNAP family protein [candidate division Zixibacteria bacterium]